MLPFSQIIRKSIETVRVNKWLLIYGLVLGSTGNSVSSNSSFDSSSIESEFGDDLNSIFNSGSPEAALSQTNQILGTATDSLSKWFTSVPMYKWALLIALIVVGVLLLIAITQVIVSWAYGGLIKGIDLAQRENKDVTLLSTSPYGIKNMKQVFLLGLRTAFYTLGFILVALLPGIFFGILTAVNEAFLVLLIIYSIVALIGVILMLVVLQFSYVYGLRFVILEGHKNMVALKSGYRLFRENIKATIITSFINLGFGMVAGIIIAILTIPALLPFAASEVPGVAQMFVAGWIILLAVFVALVVNAALMVLIQSNWNQVFHALIKEHHLERNEESLIKDAKDSSGIRPLND